MLIDYAKTKVQYNQALESTQKDGPLNLLLGDLWMKRYIVKTTKFALREKALNCGLI